MRIILLVLALSAASLTLAPSAEAACQLPCCPQCQTVTVGCGAGCRSLCVYDFSTGGCFCDEEPTGGCCMQCILYNPFGCSEYGDNLRPINLKAQLALILERETTLRASRRPNRKVSKVRNPSRDPVLGR